MLGAHGETFAEQSAHHVRRGFCEISASRAKKIRNQTGLIIFASRGTLLTVCAHMSILLSTLTPT